MPLRERLRVLWFLARHGEWSAGWERYPGKPVFSAAFEWYDFWNLAIHCGPLWICAIPGDGRE